MKNFVHFHNHTFYSFLDGMGSPEERILKAKELGMTAMAITDHNHVGGIPEFQAACKKHGIKPILGCEVYYTHDMNTIMLPKADRDKIALESALVNGIVIPEKAKKKDIAELISPYQYDTKGYHMILIAKNQTGWNNLVKIQSISSERGLFNGRYHCDKDLLKRYSEGLICTTACIGSYVCSLLRKNQYEQAKNELLSLIDIFGQENVLVEIQGLNWMEQYLVNLLLIDLSKELKLKVIATNDVHYTNKEDYDDHDTLLCIGTGKLKEDTERITYEHEFWVKDYQEMIDSFNRLGSDNKDYMDAVIQALENTNLIADIVDADIKLGSDVPLFTMPKLPEGVTPEQEFSRQCWGRLYDYLKEKGKTSQRVTYEKRLSWELYVICKKGYAPYMLNVGEYMNWAFNNSIPIGTGRGSAAGSLALFLTGITKEIDPIEYGLLFSRFLTMDRTALPDIDTDICYFGRARVIKHLEELYGHECVCHIGTYTEMGVKSGLKDVGRALNIDFGTMNSITKEIDIITGEAPGIKFKHLDAFADGDEREKQSYNKFKELEEKHAEIFRLARRFEGTKRNFGIHASGVLVTPMPVTDIVPTRFDPKSGVSVALYTGPQLEAFNLVKYDILGLKTLTVIDKTLKSIDENLTWNDLYSAVEIDDDGVFNMLSEKKTDAVFQLESDLFKGCIGDMNPENIHNIIALTSLMRPGPLSVGMHTQYNNRKNGIEPVTYLLHDTEDILEKNYGCIIYQEDIMRIAQKVAGFDDNQADSFLRKATAKKKKDLMDLCEQWFKYGKVNEQPPEGYSYKNKQQVYYDPTCKYGAPIKGGINNGYKLEDLETYSRTIEGFCSYLFNASHAAAYSYISLLTAYLKCYYPVEFFASVLTMEGNEDKKAKYIKLVEEMGITIDVPNVNISKRDFTPLAEQNKILYGLGSIKGVGDSSIDPIIENTPYNTLEDLLEKLPKKAFNKRVAIALAKCGALDSLNINRNALINQLYDLRKDKDERLNEFDYNEDICIAYETDTLGAPITYKPWFDSIAVGETVNITVDLISRMEKVDKNGNLMAFAKTSKKGCNVECVIFAKTYNRCSQYFDPDFYGTLTIRGKKDTKNKFLVSSVVEGKLKHVVDNFYGEEEAF